MMGFNMFQHGLPTKSLPTHQVNGQDSSWEVSDLLSLAAVRSHGRAVRVLAWREDVVSKVVGWQFVRSWRQL